MNKFTQKQIGELRSRFSNIDTVNPESPIWQKTEAYVAGLSVPVLRQLEQADIKWISGLARLNLVSGGPRASRGSGIPVSGSEAARKARL